MSICHEKGLCNIVQRRRGRPADPCNHCNFYHPVTLAQGKRETQSHACSHQGGIEQDHAGHTQYSHHRERPPSNRDKSDRKTSPPTMKTNQVHSKHTLKQPQGGKLGLDAFHRFPSAHLVCTLPEAQTYVSQALPCTHRKPEARHSVEECPRCP